VAVLSHAPISNCIPSQVTVPPPKQQPKLDCIFQVTKNPLDGFPVCRTRFGGETQYSLDSKRDVRPSSEGCIHEQADSFVVGDIAHWANLAVVDGDCDEESQVWVSMGVDTGLRSADP
jgi:hypothetical protein